MQLNTVAKHSVMTEMPLIFLLVSFFFSCCTVNWRNCPRLNSFFCSPFCPFSFVERVSSAETKPWLQFVSNQLVGGQPWKNCVRCWASVGARRFWFWEVSCKSSRTFSLRLTDLGSGDFILSTSFDSDFHLSCLRIFASFVFRYASHQLFNRSFGLYFMNLIVGNFGFI